jgi:hypothetical protein
MACRGAELAHPLPLWRPREAACGDSKGMPADPHPADALQLCKGQVGGSQVQRTHRQVPGTHPADICAQQDLIPRAFGVAGAVGVSYTV